MPVFSKNVKPLNFQNFDYSVVNRAIRLCARTAPSRDSSANYFIYVALFVINSKMISDMHMILQKMFKAIDSEDDPQMKRGEKP